MPCNRPTTTIILNTPYVLPGSTPVQPILPVEPSFVYVADVENFTLSTENSNRDIVIDNQIGNSGVLRLNVDVSVVEGTKWNLNVLYGRNGGDQYEGGTSIVVLYGLDGSSINVTKSIEDHQTILQVRDGVGVLLNGGRIQRGIVSGGPGSRLIGMSNRITYLNTIEEDSTFSRFPNSNGDATGTPTLTNYGVVHAKLTILYIGVRTTPAIIENPTLPTFLVTGENTYFSAIVP